MPTQGYDIDNDDHYIEVIGTNSADTIDGWNVAGSQFIDGKGGDDEIYGGLGVDHILGGHGNDDIYAWEDADGVTSLSQILETIILKVTKAFGMMEVERTSAMRNLTLKI